MRKPSKKKFPEEASALTLLATSHTKPLKLWTKRIRGGHIQQVLDKDLHCSVLEMVSEKPRNTYITCPSDPRKVLGVAAPFLHLTVRNLQMPLAIDVLVRDNKNVERRFRATTKQRETEVKPYKCTMPLTLEKGWNDVTVPLVEFTRKAYGTAYVETLRVQVHATCRVQRVYFSHKVSPENLSDCRHNG